MRLEVELAGVLSTVHYPLPLPLNERPAMEDARIELQKDDCAAEQVLSLPLHPYLTERDVVQIAEALHRRVRVR